MMQRVEECRESEGRAVMARIGLLKSRHTHPERGQTSAGSFVTRELEKPLKEGKQMRAENTTACAPSGMKVNWNTINWQTVNRNVKRLQARIVKATQEKL